MDNKNKKMKDISILDFQSLKILLAGDKEINEWSYGEVTKPETINYRTLRPEKDGLFDERIFGPTKDWECYCGKYKRIRYRGIVCDKCGVEVTLSRVRRERMGHIGLAAPVAHVWYFKGSSSSLSLILNMSQKDLESVIYYASYLVTGVDEEKKKKALEGFAENVEVRKDNLKKDSEKEEEEVNKDIDAKLKEIKTKNEEQKKLMEQELELSRKQRLARISDRLAQESKKIDEIADALNTLVKSLKPGSVLSEDEYFKVLEYDIPVFFSLKTGAEGLLELIEKVNIDEMIIELRKEVEKSKGQKYLKLIKRLRLLEVIRKAGVKPKDMVYTVLPVIPPDLRPMVQLSGGRFATSDLNDLYRRVINRNNRLKHLMSLGAPEIILRNEKRMLQESVDSLIDASQRGSQVVSSPLRSLSDMLRGKQGRFRQNLLGKRVDYSGRSVIVVGPDLKLSECGLPKEMALEMFKPFVLREVIVRGYAPNIKSAKRFIEKRPPEVFDILEEITKNHPVLLNRAPTLHKLGIQAFYPKLIEGAAIQLHPCVCKGYNADFDGDQMAVHIPLSDNAQKEAIELMMPRENLLKPADGAPITLPDKEMAIGIYYLTTIDEPLKAAKEEQKYFANANDALLGFSLKKVGLREPIQVKIEDEMIETTIGRLMLNEHLPKEMGFVNKPIKASGIKELIIKAMNVADSEEVEKLIDRIKTLGFYGSTVSGISVSVFDTALVAEKQDLIDAAEVKIADIDSEYQQGLITNEERKRLSNEVWMKTTEQIADMTWDLLTPENVIRTIIDSEGARAGKEQLKQLSAMRGLILDPLGKIVELPIKSNFREGLSIFEYVSSARGSRKGLTDSALKTANAGYLTRRLVDVSHDMIIREEDCGTKHGITVRATDENRTASFKDRILGRIAAENIIAPKGKKVIVKAGEEIDDEKVEEVIANDVEEAKVRSVITCELKYGICSACYGWDFSVKRKVALGVPVGVIAAQSIGEPGTQLTMRVRHFGGVVMSDVTQGLPRVEELFRNENSKGIISCS